MILFASFFSRTGDGLSTLEMGQSTDFTTWTKTPNWSSGIQVADPSLILWKGAWYIVATGGDIAAFTLRKSTGIGQAWTSLNNVDVSAIGGTPATWAPEWFVDPADGSLHVIFAYSKTGSLSFTRAMAIYEIHPTDPTDLNGSWSTPVELLSGTIPFGNSAIDPFIVCKSGTYYLFFVQDNGGSRLVEVVSASSLTGTYSGYKSGDWAGWGAGKEGPSLVKDSSGRWWAYFDNSGGSLNFGQIQYSYSDDNWATWSTPANISQPDFSQTKHGTVWLSYNDVMLTSTIPTGESWPKPTLEAIGSLSGFLVAKGSRLGTLRLGAARLGSGEQNLRQTVTLSAKIASGETWFTGDVMNTITPAAAIPTGESWPTPKVAGPVTLAAKIASGETWPTGQLVQGFNVTLGSSMASAESWPTPKIAGPVSSATIAAGESWPTPKLNLKLSVGAAIATGEHWPTAPVITVSQNVAPSAAIPTGEAWFSPKLNLKLSLAAKIASGEEWPTPVVSGPVKSAAIASGESWPTADVAGPITIATIGLGEVWFIPHVAGPITLGGSIPTGEHWPTPDVKLSQTVTLAALIASGEVWPSPRVNHTQTIRPASGIASAELWPTPRVSGSPHWLNVQGIPSRESWPIPSVSGGKRIPIQLFLGGTDVTKYLRFQTAQISSQTIGRWAASFDLFIDDGAFAPALGQIVQIVDFGRRQFAGCLASVIADRAMCTDHEITFHCKGVDKSGICDHRVILAKTYTAGTDVASVLLDIVANCLDGEGITTARIPIDGTLGNLASDQIFNANTVTQAFDSVCTDAGLIWGVDAYGALYADSLDSLPDCPYTLTETGKNWRNLTAEQTLLNYRNKQYAVSNLNVLPGSGSGGGAGGGVLPARQESFTWANGNQGITSAGGVPVGLIVSMPIGQVLSITVNGVAQTVVDFNNFAGQNSSGPSDYGPWFYLGSYQSGGVSGSNSQINPTFGPLPANATVIVNYIPFALSAAAQPGAALAPVGVSGFPTKGTLGTCGSGIYEAVEQVVNVSDQADLQAIAAAVLTRNGGIPVLTRFETDQPGAAPGQLMRIVLPKVGLADAKHLVTTMQGVSLGVDLGYGSTFRWQIETSSTTDPGNWIKWFENLVRRTQNALPVYQYQTAKFILAPGASLSAGAVGVNPHIVERTGLLVDMYAAAAQPPIDEDLVLTANLNGARIPGSVVIPAGSTANTEFRFTFPAGTPMYVFARPAGPNDIITPSVSYRQTGPDPTAASSVSFYVRYRM